VKVEEKLELVTKALDAQPGTLKAETSLQELDEWDSLGVISLIAMIDKHFSVRLEPEKIRAFKTVRDILDQMGNEGGNR
jgi:acyl carrier protein